MKKKTPRILSFYLQYKQWMKGRYGRKDTLYYDLLRLSFLSLVVAFFIFRPVFILFSFLLLGYQQYRFFSKYFYVRVNENTRYVAKKKAIFSFIHQKKKRLFSYRTHVYFPCPFCHTSLRVPRHKGKLNVTCPSCKHSFIKKS